MEKKYPEMIQFFRDCKNGNPESNIRQLQKAVNEYQYFAKVYQEVTFVLTFEIKSLDKQIIECMSPKILKIYSNPKLQLVLDQAKIEIAESIYFHSSDIN